MMRKSVVSEESRVRLNFFELLLEASVATDSLTQRKKKQSIVL